MQGKELDVMPMECAKFRKSLNAVLDQEWVPEGAVVKIPPELEAHARYCPSCATVLETVRILVLPAEKPPAVPAGLADRIADAVIGGAKTYRRRRNVLRWSAGLAAAAVLVIASVFTTTLVGDLSAPGAGVTSANDTVVIRFEFEAPAARSVAVVGDWNGWNPEVHRMMQQSGTDIWGIELEVFPNREYRYQFLVDGEQWLPDPAAPITVSDGFGGKNSVLDI